MFRPGRIAISDFSVRPDDQKSPLLKSHHLNILPISISRIVINDPNMLKFDVSSKYDHVEPVNQLKVSLIQQAEESADGSSPKIFDVELNHHQSGALLINCMKVRM